MNNDLISRKALLAEVNCNDWYEGHCCAACDAIKAAPSAVTGETSDGYHTFNELYRHRAVLFSVIVKTFPEKAWKARQHSDGSMFDGMFIVGIDTPDGPATYHYDLDPYWDMFRCKEVERAPEWDGHTAADAIERIGKLEPVQHGRWGFLGMDMMAGSRAFYFGTCSECRERINFEAAHKNFCPNCGAKMEEETDAHN